jgi:dTDP-4-dehydrorhamnose reductase
MRVLVIGQSGQLGQSLVTNGKLGYDFPFFDLRNTNYFEIQKFESEISRLHPDAIVNAAAFTDVDAAETQKNLAEDLNVLLPDALSRISSNLGIPFYHVSTDYVFSGISNSPWEITSPQKPIGIYAKTKLAGEKISIKNYENGTRILRTAWLYSKYRKNFAKTMIRLALGNNQKIDVVADQTGQPTSAKDLADQIFMCLKQNIAPGIYHATNSGQATWNEFAKEIFSLIGEDPNRVVPMISTELKRPAPRPTYSVLSHYCWENTKVKPMRDWREALKDQIQEIKAAVIAEGI